MILTEIGEVGVHLGDETYVLRPSLYSMSLLGEPRWIVKDYVKLMSNPINRSDRWQQFLTALRVVHSCSEKDIGHVFGYLNDKRKYVSKLASMNDIIVLGRHLIEHGITGVQPPLPRKHDQEAEYSEEFHARDHVATAVAHLGVTEREAWQMTMTSLVGALRAKFPQTDIPEAGSKAPSSEELDAALAWHDKVLEKRRKKKERR